MKDLTRSRDSSALRGRLLVKKKRKRASGQIERELKNEVGEMLCLDGASSAGANIKSALASER